MHHGLVLTLETGNGYGNTVKSKFDPPQLAEAKMICQRHCVSNLSHSLASCYDHACVVKFVWTQVVRIT